VNALGQITTYAQGDYTTTVDYNAYGMLEEMTTGTVQEMRYAFDDAGNLSWREDVQTNQKEIFTYDELSRLTLVDYYLNGNHASSGDLDISYDDGGIITSKSDVGGTIHYGENGAGPHALTSIENPVSSYTPPPQRITYTDFNKVHTIQDTIAQDTTLTLTFSYGLNNQRVRTKLTKNSTVQRVKYFNGDYEEDSTATGIKKYHYIHAPTGLVGIFVKDGNGNDTLYHVLTDHLRSLTAVINAETDSVTRYSYSAWGNPRDPQDWTQSYEGELFAGRGYTGHEHLQAFDLINMNGRVYDPVLARFLSPDPFVQFPGIADGWNRYGYVMNNPMKFTDPSGYEATVGSLFDEKHKNNKYPGGSFLYRGYYYVWDYKKQGYTIWGNSFGDGPVGFAPGGGSGYTNYDFTNIIASNFTGYNWNDGQYYENGSPVPYRRFHSEVILPNSYTYLTRFSQAFAKMKDGSFYYGELKIYDDKKNDRDSQKEVVGSYNLVVVDAIYAGGITITYGHFQSSNGTLYRLMSAGYGIGINLGAGKYEGDVLANPDSFSPGDLADWSLNVSGDILFVGGEVSFPIEYQGGWFEAYGLSREWWSYGVGPSVGRTKGFSAGVSHAWIKKL